MIFDKLNRKLGNKLSALIIIFAVSLLSVLVLLGVKLLPSTATRLDFSSNSMYTLSPETEELIKNVNQPVTIYLVSAAGEENKGIRTFLERYSNKSRNITFKTLDSVADAEEIYNYAVNPPSNSIIVKTENRYKLIPYYDLFYLGEDAYNFAYQTYVQYYNAGIISSSLSFTDYVKDYAIYDGCYTGYEYEESVNAAIRYVTSDSLKKVYLLYGHNEDAPSFDIYNHITNFGIELTRINADKNDIPADADLLLLFPNEDISSAEANRLSEYMKNGGKAMVVTTQGISYTFLNAVLKEYGVETDGKYLCEDNENYNLGGIPAYTVPDVSDETLAALLEEQAASVLFAGTTGITVNETLPAGVTVKPLFTSSPESYTTEDVTNYKFDAEKDTRKIRYTGVSAFNENGGGFVWISAPSMLYEEYTVYTNGGNLITLMHYINQLSENTPVEPIPAVMLSNARLSAPRWFVITFAAILCGVAPLSLMGFALYRRKRRLSIQY